MQGASGIVKLPPLPVTRSKTLAATKVTQTQKAAAQTLPTSAPRSVAVTRKKPLAQTKKGPAKKGVSPLDNSLPDSTSVPNFGNKLRAGETEQRTPSPLSSLSPSPYLSRAQNAFKPNWSGHRGDELKRQAADNDCGRY
ncbi:hypothetical protein BD779DRAFT_1472375 [Infundibulicybe gibba]|nr:hypothetical protein BD779DRAFT_1472375 [Infundibulicybe gibba]